MPLRPTGLNVNCVAASLICFLAGLSAKQESLAQQEAPPVEATPRVIALQAVGDKENGMTIIAGGDGAGFIPFTFNMGGGLVTAGGGLPQDDLGILTNEQLHEDLALVPEQKQKLSNLRRTMQERRVKSYAEVRTLEPSKVGELVRENEKQIQEETRKQIAEILLPQQIERLRQVKVQMQMRSRGANALTQGEIADLLALTDQQKADLAEKQREAEKKLREKIEEIRKQLVKDVVRDVLNVEQRAKLTEILGADLQLKTPEIVAPAVQAIVPRGETSAPRIKPNP
jgi:hypothetical protein